MSWIFGGASNEDSEVRAARILQLERELQASEARLPELVRAFPEPVWILDSKLKPRFWNAPLLQLSRKQQVPEQELVRLGARAWFREPEVHAALEQVLASASTVQVQFELEGRFYELSCSSYDDGVIAVFHDVTQLKRAEQARLDMVVNVSHELRTPLTAIKGFTDTLVEDLKARRLEDCDAHAAVITRNVSRLMELIGDVLAISSLESGVDSLQLRPISTREVTDSALRSLEPVYRASGHRISTEFLAESLEGDPARIEQVLVNLIGNALRYVPAAQGPILVRWVPSEVSGRVELRVEDRGSGIPEELKPRIFERFYRVDHGRSRESGGTGLGLSIVKHIVLRHGGSVWVEDREGGGAAFVCRF